VDNCVPNVFSWLECVGYQNAVERVWSLAPTFTKGYWLDILVGYNLSSHRETPMRVRLDGRALKISLESPLGRMIKFRGELL
jgi:hypothetical protein